MSGAGTMESEMTRHAAGSIIHYTLERHQYGLDRATLIISLGSRFILHHRVVNLDLSAPEWITLWSPR